MTTEDVRQLVVDTGGDQDPPRLEPDGQLAGWAGQTGLGPMQTAVAGSVRRMTVSMPLPSAGFAWGAWPWTSVLAGVTFAVAAPDRNRPQVLTGGNG